MIHSVPSPLVVVARCRQAGALDGVRGRARGLTGARAEGLHSPFFLGTIRTLSRWRAFEQRSAEQLAEGLREATKVVTLQGSARRTTDRATAI